MKTMGGANTVGDKFVLMNLASSIAITATMVSARHKGWCRINTLGAWSEDPIAKAESKQSQEPGSRGHQNLPAVINELE